MQARCSRTTVGLAAWHRGERRAVGVVSRRTSLRRSGAVGDSSPMDGLQHASKKLLLRAALTRQERTVGHMLDEIEQHPRLSLREETLTERMLLDLALDPAFRSAATASMFSTAVEGRTGADWLWVFQGRDGGSSELLVQAKRLRHGCYALNQAAAPSQRSRHNTQRAVLLAHSSATGLPAAYAFYNPTSTAGALTVGCGWDVMLGPLGGVALADATAVDAEVNAAGITAEHVDAGTVAAVAWPLSCALLCADCYADEGSVAEPLDVVVGAALAATGIRPPDSAGVPQLRYLVEAMRELALQRGGQGVLEELISVLQLGGVLVVSERMDL